MKIGARTFKTGLVVAITIFLVNILEAKTNTIEYNIAGMAAFTAIIAMQPSIKGSLKTFKNRVIATFIGTLIAFVLAFTLGLNAFYLGLASIAIILICLKLSLDESISFALITLVAIGTYHNDFNIMGVICRVSGVLIGLLVSTGLNILFIPPDYSDDLKEKINELRLKFEGLFEDIMGDLLRDAKVEKETIKDKRQIIRDELDDSRDIYSLLVGDILPKNEKPLKKYRRSINAIQSNLERLTAIHRSIIFMPSDSAYLQLRKDLYKYLEYLLLLHRQIYEYIALDKEYRKITKSINKEEIQAKIVKLIKVDNNENVFEFYNVFFEASRINDKLEQLKSEFGLSF